MNSSSPILIVSSLENAIKSTIFFIKIGGGLGSFFSSPLLVLVGCWERTAKGFGCSNGEVAVEVEGVGWRGAEASSLGSEWEGGARLTGEACVTSAPVIRRWVGFVGGGVAGVLPGGGGIFFAFLGDGGEMVLFLPPLPMFTNTGRRETIAL